MSAVELIAKLAVLLAGMLFIASDGDTRVRRSEVLVRRAEVAVGYVLVGLAVWALLFG